VSKVGIYSAMYNSEKYIAEMIRSVQKQTFSNWELSIVDDGSSDNSIQAAIKASNDDPRIKINSIEHCGIVGKVKNRAISFLKNPDYCCGVDSDDFIDERTLEIFSNYLDNNSKIGALCGNFICFNEEKQWQLGHVSNSEEFDSNTLLKYMNYFPLRFYRKVVFDLTGGYSEELTNADDYDLALKIDEITEIRRIKEPITYFYRQHETQISSVAKQKENENAKIT